MRIIRGTPSELCGYARPHSQREILGQISEEIEPDVFRYKTMMAVAIQSMIKLSVASLEDVARDGDASSRTESKLGGQFLTPKHETIPTLEARLGLQLLTRTTRSVAPTKVGDAC
jgi:hypothetical protein